MTKQVYIVEGANLPAKVVVVAFGLEHETILEIENRFLTGAKYSSLLPAHHGVIKLANPLFGPHDQAFFPGWDSFRQHFKGGSDSVPTDKQPGRIVQTEEPVPTGRVAFLVERSRAGVIDNWILVYEDRPGVTAENLAKTISEMPVEFTMDIKHIGSGTFQAAPELVQAGFALRVAPRVSYQVA